MAKNTHHKYDLIPYPEWSITESHPNHMAVIGRLLGVNTPAPDQCRVLELGCASGGNLIPAAYYWPDAEFVGVELSKRQVQHGNLLMQEVGLTNAKILHRDIMQVDKRMGMFDYIIVHGVYSWVPPKVQERILKICREMLNRNGLAYISYNTLPGWSMRNMIRAMLFYHVQGVADPKRQLQQSQAFIKMMAQALPEHGSLSERWLKHETTDLVKAVPDYLFHDYLEENNHPLFFHQFMTQASANGLRYVADATLSTMLASALTPEANAFLDTVDNLVDYEQYMDFFYLRHFRQSVLCHAERRPKRALDIGKFTELYLAAHLSCDDDINLHDVHEQTFKGLADQLYQVTQPLTKAALVVLTMDYPNMLSLQQIQSRAHQLLEQYGDRRFLETQAQLPAELLNLYLSGALQASPVQRRIFSELSARPVASPLARVYAKYRKGYVATAHHDSMELDYLGWKLLSMANGKRERGAICRQIAHAVQQPGPVQRYFYNKGLTVETAQAHVEAQIEAQLFQFATQGLLSM